MIHKILIVDDQHTDRETAYRQLLGSVAAQSSLGQIDPLFVRLPAELPGILQREQISGAMIDAVLTDRWPGFTVEEAAGQISRMSIPFAIVSTQWNVANANSITRAYEYPECKAFLQWRDIEAVANYPVMVLAKLISDGIDADTSIRCDHDESIYIVHISDPQFGGFREEQFHTETMMLAEQILLDTNNSRWLFLAVSGDITEHGYGTEFAAASVWIRELGERLNIGEDTLRRRLLLCPGNHDVNLPICLLKDMRLARAPTGGFMLTSPAGETPEGSSLSAEDWLSLSTSEYRRFSEELTDHVEVAPFTWTEQCYRHLGFEFYGLSTVRPQVGGLPLREVSEQSVKSLWKQLGLGMRPGERVLRIGIGHHNPIADMADNSVTNPSVFERLFNGRESRTALFLHGHVHKAQFKYHGLDYRIVTSQASSASKGAAARPEDSLRGFNLIKLGRDQGCVTSVSGKVYEWRGAQLSETSSQQRQYTVATDGMLREL